MATTSPTVTVAIPTYESSKSLIVTVNSIREQTAFKYIQKILIVVDGKKMNPNIRKKLNHPKITIVQKAKQLGQSARLQDLFGLSRAELLILTNDDVVLEKNAVASFIDAYQKSNADFFSASALPFKGEMFLQHMLAVSYEINSTLISLLKGKTYLSANGRLLALTKKMYKSVKIPQKLQNNDAYLYFAAHLNGFNHTHVPSAKAYFHSPSTLKEHMKQSRKFQLSQIENQQYFEKNISGYYTVSKKRKLQAIGKVFLRQPILTICYVFLHIVSRLALQKIVPQSGVWETDHTTKVADTVHRNFLLAVLTCPPSMLTI